MNDLDKKMAGLCTALIALAKNIEIQNPDMRGTTTEAMQAAIAALDPALQNSPAQEILELIAAAAYTAPQQPESQQ